MAFDYIDPPADTGKFDYIDTPEQETGALGQELPPPSAEKVAAEEPEKMGSPGLQDVSVPDAMMVESIPGIAKLGGGLLAKGAGAALNAIPATENILPSIERMANNQTLKSMGGSTAQLGQMEKAGGRKAVDAAAEYARDNKLADVFSTQIGREKQLKALKDASGETVGSLRKEAGMGPKISDLIKMVRDKFASKYTSGIHSGEMGEFQKALDEVQKLAPIEEIPQSEKIASQLENYKPGTHEFDVSEKNPLYTDVPEKITPKLNTAQPVVKDQRMIDLGLKPKVESPDFPGPFKNPQFLSDEPTITSPSSIPVHPYDKARQALEELDIPEFETTKNASHVDIADKMTELNKHAEAQSGMFRPSGATTDVADTISGENNSDIAQKLGSDKARKYVDALGEQSKLHPLEYLQKRGELRNAGSRGGMGSATNSIIQSIKNKVGYRISAKTLAAIQDALEGEDLARGNALQDYLMKQFSKK